MGTRLDGLMRTCQLTLSTSKENIEPHLTRPPEYVYSKGPSPESRRFSMRKTDSTVTEKINNVASTKYFPGQMRFPNPKTDGSVESSRKVPSGVRNRSGLNTSGSGYTSGSCRIALKTMWIIITTKDCVNTSYHIFPITQAPSQTCVSERT